MKGEGENMNVYVCMYELQLYLQIWGIKGQK